MKERDPRVEAIAAKLVEIQPYGKDWRKTEPSTADYHVALIAVRTLDERAEYEYGVQTSFLNDSPGLFKRDLTYIVGNWNDKEFSERLLKRLLEEPSTGTYTLVKRRKAGPIEAA